MPVVEACWACGGSGYHLKSVGPISFKPCWMCYGQRGKSARQPVIKNVIGGGFKLEGDDRITYPSVIETSTEDR